MTFEYHLRVYSSRSEFHVSEDTHIEYNEGITSNKAKLRHKIIKEKFENNFLEDLILNLKSGLISVNLDKISKSTQRSITNLNSSVTSEVGRAIIGLAIMQLCIKSISPEQSIRLHKASSSTNSFSWSEGISMRTLDKQYVTPVLRKFNLVKLNADGFMMTRSLAENYPYTDLYKAQIRGARIDWLNLVNDLENNITDPFESLKFFISLLINSAEDFSTLSDVTVKNLDLVKSNKFKIRESVYKFINNHINESDYAARLFEISIHALAQAFIESQPLNDLELKPLSQMRSANKKHGNIGDIEFLQYGEIVESYDAKYGKNYLREEIEESVEKINNHNNVKIISFITNEKIPNNDEINYRLTELIDLYNITFSIIDFQSWVDLIYSRAIDSNVVSELDLSVAWITNYTKSLGQKNRHLAPIDEPCLNWLQSLNSKFSEE